MTNWYNDEGDEPAQPVQGSNQGFYNYLQTNYELRDIKVHYQFCAELIEHIWAQYNNLEIIFYIFQNVYMFLKFMQVIFFRCCTPSLQIYNNNLILYNLLS